MEKVPPSERLSKEIEEALSGFVREEGDLPEVLIEKSVMIDASKDEQLVPSLIILVKVWAALRSSNRLVDSSARS